jgi:hypothetical protein
MFLKLIIRLICRYCFALDLDEYQTKREQQQQQQQQQSYKEMLK